MLLAMLTSLLFMQSPGSCYFELKHTPPVQGFGFEWFAMDDTCDAGPYTISPHDINVFVDFLAPGKKFVYAAGPAGTYKICVQNNLAMEACVTLRLNPVNP